MKTKSFLLGAAALMLATACTNDEVVNVAPQSGAIGFSSFVDNATRADVNTINSIKQFNVWGVTANGPASVAPSELFDGLNVDRAGDAPNYTWSYSPLRFWIAGNDYSFAAVAPYNATGLSHVQTASLDEAGLTFTFNNKTAGAAVDLLYASDDVTGASATQAAVNLNFKHMLSKVKFQFENKLKSGTIKVVGLTINNATEEATITKAAATGLWTAVEGKDPLVVGFNCNAELNKNVNSDPMFLIPVTGGSEYDVTFTIELYANGTDKSAEYKHNVKLSQLEYKNNYSYNFKAVIDETTIDPENPELKPIEFKAEVTDYIDAAEGTLPTEKKPQTETPAE